MPTLHPEPGYVLVRQDAPEDTSEGGIVLPDESKQRPLTGTILASNIGEDTFSNVLDAAKVLFSPYAGISTEVTGEELLLLRREDILATLTDTDN